MQAKGNLDAPGSGKQAAAPELGPAPVSDEKRHADKGNQTQDDSAVKAARAQFDKGKAEYNNGHFGRAYDYFQIAYELSPRPAVMYSMAQALRRMGGRREEALRLYEQYLASGHSKYAKSATAAIQELGGKGSFPPSEGQRISAAVK